MCGGTGRIDGGDIAGVEPIVVLRAALMGIGEGVSREKLRAVKLLGEAGSGATCEPPEGMAERQAVGRAAGQLLRDLGLRPPLKRKALTKEERAARKRAKEAQREQNRIFAERMERDRAEREEQRRRAIIDRRAAAEVASRYPDQMQEEREAQEVFVALENGLPDPSYAQHWRSKIVR